MPDHNHKKLEKEVLELVRHAVKQDEELRKKYQISNKFRFVRDRLQALLERLEQHVKTFEVVKSKITQTTSAADEVIVYVYLYNTQGTYLRSWQNMLTPKVFYEYSVNRPIYSEKHHIETLLRSKENKLQHAYLTVAVRSQDILRSPESKDSLGQPLLKVREGALRIEKLISLTHNEHDYKVDDEGMLIKRSDSL